MSTGATIVLILAMASLSLWSYARGFKHGYDARADFEAQFRRPSPSPTGDQS